MASKPSFRWGVSSEPVSPAAGVPLVSCCPFPSPTPRRVHCTSRGAWCWMVTEIKAQCPDGGSFLLLCLIVSLLTCHPGCVCRGGTVGAHHLPADLRGPMGQPGSEGLSHSIVTSTPKPSLKTQEQTLISSEQRKIMPLPTAEA